MYNWVKNAKQKSNKNIKKVRSENLKKGYQVLRTRIILREKSILI